jgi:tetratricopeptide (TPR) repeat protein
LSEFLRFAGDNERALRTKNARAALKAPEVEADRVYFEGLVRATEGDDRAAIEAFARALETADDTAAATVMREDYARSGLAAAIRNQEQRNLALLRARQERGEFVSTLELALAHVKTGDVENSLAWLDRAREEGAPAIHEYLAHIAFDPFPVLAPLREDPRFDRLLAAAGLPPMRTFRAAADRARQAG